MNFTSEEIEALRWLVGGSTGQAVRIPQRLVLRGYVDFDHAFKPQPFLTRRGATSAKVALARRDGGSSDPTK